MNILKNPLWLVFFSIYLDLWTPIPNKNEMSSGVIFEWRVWLTHSCDSLITAFIECWDAVLHTLTDNTILSDIYFSMKPSPILLNSNSYFYCIQSLWRSLSLSRMTLWINCKVETLSVDLIDPGNSTFLGSHSISSVITICGCVYNSRYEGSLLSKKIVDPSGWNGIKKSLVYIPIGYSASYGFSQTDIPKNLDLFVWINKCSISFPNVRDSL